MTTVLLDTHVLLWWRTTPGQLSDRANNALERADELAVASVTWYELAWLCTHARIQHVIPMRTWLERLARGVRTISTTPAIAATAAELPPTFPQDPADRVIYATAIEKGWPLVTKDGALRRHGQRKRITVW